MKKFNLIDWAFSTILVGNVLQLFIPSSNELSLAIAPAVAGALITVGGSLLGGLFGKRKPPVDPSAQWYGMGAESVYNQGRALTDNPYGLGSDTIRSMRSIGRDTLTAGYDQAGRQQDQRFAASGLSQAGGTRSRMDYYAGQQMGEGLSRMYNQIEIADFQAREAQRIRGENMLMSLSNRNPIYSQLSSQNYWRSLNDQQSFQQSIAGAAGSWYQNYLYNQGQGQGQDPYLATGQREDETYQEYTDWLGQNTSPQPNPYGESQVTSPLPNTSGG